MQKRRRFKQTKSLKDRLLEGAQNFREEAKLLPYGSMRDAALKGRDKRRRRPVWMSGSTPRFATSEERRNSGP
jgi:hypothetical protein